MSQEPASQRERLVEAKLRGLTRQLTDQALVTKKAPGGSGGLVASEGYLVLDSGSESAGMSRRRATGENSVIRGLGPALIWSRSVGATRLNLFVDDGGPALARRAAYFGDHIAVWEVDGAELNAVIAEPIGPAPELSPEVLSWQSLIIDCGATPVDDYGRLVAEVRGLEVARVVVEDDGSTVLEVGVGQADRELHRLVHSNLDAEGSLRRAVAMVLETRVPGAVRHPLQRLARERWYRSAIVAAPSLVGAQSLLPVAPLRERATLLGSQPAAAVGVATDGSPVVVVCSVGVDPDLLPEAADYRQRSNPDAALLVVIPERDRLPTIDSLISQLPDARFESVALPWEEPEAS